MSRVKRGVETHKRHKKVLELAAGYRMTKSRLYKVAKEAVLHAGEYAFAGRRHRKRQMRRLWIARINAASREVGIKYSDLINLLKKKNIELDRKILSNIAQEPKLFSNLIDEIKKA